MDILKVKRGYVKGSLTRIATFCEKITGDITSEALQTRLDRLESIWSEFLQIQNEFAAFCEDPKFQDQTPEYEDFEKNYIAAKQRLLHAINIRNDKTPNEPLFDRLASQQTSFLERFSSTLNSNNSTHNNSHIFAKLPKLDLPKFSGNYNEWISFQDLFIATVDKNPNLSDSQRLNYLKTYVIGDAAALLRYVPISDANYASAWKRLQDRYNRKDQIVKSFIRTFLSLPHITNTSMSGLRILADGANEVIRGLEAIDVKATARDPWLIYLLLQKTDTDTRQEWAREIVNCEFPTIEMLISFLDKRSQAIEDSIDKFRQSSNRTNSSNVKVHSTAIESCPKCYKTHLLGRCPEFKLMSIDDKRKFVRDTQLCYNCLRHDHTAKMCRSMHTCRHCNGKHHSLVHLNRESDHVTLNQINNSPSTNQLKLKNDHPSKSQPAQGLAAPIGSHLSSNNAAIYSPSLLPTALVFVLDSHGNKQPFRVLLDSGSQVSFVTESCVRRLGLRRRHSRIPVSGVSSCAAGITRGIVKLHLQSRINQSTLDIDAFILNRLTADVPSCLVKSLPQLNTLQLADPNFNIPGPIDIIVGADKLFQILENGRFILDDDRLVIQLTNFGWIVTGQQPLLHQDDKLESSIEINTASLCHNIDIDHLLYKFWEMEEINYSNHNLSPDELKAEDIFSLTTTRADDGKYIVELPFRTPIIPLGKSYHTALKRLQSMEGRFEKSDSLKNSYSTFMDEYLKLNHMEKVPPNEVKSTNCYYLPHHAVFKPDSSTTKLRVVFDGSAKSSSGFSLNDALLIGPPIQRDLLTVCIRFRLYRYVFTADLEKMYRQIWVSNKHADFQRILWRKSPNVPVEIYRLKPVTYGTSSAPFLAVRVLHQLAFEHSASHPIASQILYDNCYVDDILTGSQSIEDLVKMKTELVELLASAGFNLRKWSSNCWSFLNAIDQSQCEFSARDLINDSKSVRTLGLKWIPSADIFSFNISTTNTQTITKRTLLSEASSIFDPLGILTPATVTIKILFQSLWVLKLDWDEPVPEQIKIKWNNFRNTLPLLNSVKIPRFIGNCFEPNVELHGFSDASEKAFAAVLYCRIKINDGNYQCRLIASKSKVAPLKQISIARLELCGAILLTRLFKKILQVIKGLSCKLYAWSDSKIVLYWLSSPPRRWNTFVANRTAEIIDILPRKHWSYVKSNDNPADCASRGISPTELLQSKLWWSGPQWLQDDNSAWPTACHNFLQESIDIPEERHTPIQALPVINDNDLLNQLCHKYSTWTRLLRVLAYCFRFTRNSSKPKTKITGSLLVTELNNAKVKCLLHVQATNFQTELVCLRKHKFIQLRHQLSKLTPFIDENGLMRVGGRLKHSELSYQSKHPIILPNHNIVSTLIVRHFHFRYSHAGTSELFALLRQEYWILGSRNIIRKVVHQCLSCFRQRQQLSSQLMAHLPATRVTYARPFSHVGCDYAGPITIRSFRGRNPRFTKGYICLFICFTSKAVHIELVTELTTDAFIAALRRFVARRGKCSHIYSDNGTNFKGAYKILSEMNKLIMSETHNMMIQDYLSKDGIQWVFNPPSAPHFGGLWESGIRSIKMHLKRVIGDHRLTFEELYTVLTQIEAVVNSRPLCYIPQSEVEALTPFHLLTGTAYTSIPNSDLTSTKLNLLSNWELLQQMLQGFWKKWHTKYLTSLQQRSKWRHEQPNVNCGDVVLIKEPNLPPSKWALGRVNDIHPDEDGNVRVVTVTTNSGKFMRPIVKIVKLPLEEEWSTSTPGEYVTK